MGAPKTKTTNAKVEAALEKKAVVEAKRNAEKARQAEAEESASWAVGSNQRGASRAAADAEKAAERMRREADKKKAQEQDDAANAGVAKPKKVKKKTEDVSALLMAGLSSKEGKKKPVKKAESKDTQLRKAQAEALDKKAKAKGIVMQDDRALLVENNNRNHDDDLDATGIDDAIAVLGGGSKVESKNLKVLYAAFEEKTMPVLRAETPGLKLSQYKERCFALWQKAPENPNNPR